MEASCLELALEGERLCKEGDFKGGTAFFEAAVQMGTEDLKTLSAIYSQLGNAYFYLKETIGDRVGEGKASGNLGNTLKVLGRYDEAAVCCQRHLDISQEQGDKVGEARALYNMGNVFHAKGKQQIWGEAQDPGDLPSDVQETLQSATAYYQMNLSLVKELGDRAAQGRAFGNLGNTHYLLGNFLEAIKFHRERLSIAKEFGDKAAERRAYSNLGNALIFMGQFRAAAEYYRKTLQLSRQLKDQVMEAQACYSLGNTHTLLQEYEHSTNYHLKHLLIAQQLNDRVGEGRACWSLGNASVSMGNLRQALVYSRRHLEISKEIGDRNGELTARMNVQELMEVLGVKEADLSPSAAEFNMQGARPKFNKKNSMESVELWKYSSEDGDSWEVDGVSWTPRTQLDNSRRGKGFSESPSSDERQWLNSPVDTEDITVHVSHPKISREASDEDCFFDLLSKFQSSRMDDQRCQLDETNNDRETGDDQNSLSDIIDAALLSSPQTEELFELIASSQSRRLDDQRVSASGLPGLRITQSNLCHLRTRGHSPAHLGGEELGAQEPGDDFFNMLIKCQSSRIDDQRCSPPEGAPRAPTVPDEDFFSLIQRVQAKRMDEQRVKLPEDQSESDEPQNEHENDARDVDSG
ncbi:hypothetical protein DNTS_012013 [Danionella cerebrum]|uniref:G-protein-signaling modulator 1 n=1 Tax=Danionella cerebrum TaxID=2873325 RepID=A0A553QHW3_9TELE|nr:hypothetical protein DNTS_012013 [Danionella translucida]